MDKHQKHAKLTLSNSGEFHRNELAILGTSCTKINLLVNALLRELSLKYNIAYVDADHKAPEIDESSALGNGALTEFTNHINYRSFKYKQEFNPFENKQLFNANDLVLVNGNHFKAQCQIAVIDPVKSLENKLEKLTDIKLILLADGVDDIPKYITNHLTIGSAVPVLKLNDVLGVAGFIDNYLMQLKPVINGLVLAGGKSERMQTDKGGIVYFGKSQRMYIHEVLSSHCEQTYVSYGNEQAVNKEECLPVVLDKFIGLGPIGGILSAFQINPNAAWLTVACDLPYLTEQTLAYLVKHRNPSKLATCFMDSNGKFPEPLITIWEPRAYPVMLQFLSQGYSCPRKVLINSDVELLQAPDVAELKNVNFPAERDEAMATLNKIT